MRTGSPRSATWSEPPLSEPVAGVTGRPLGDLPEHARKRRRGLGQPEQPQLGLLAGGHYNARLPDSDSDESRSQSEAEQHYIAVEQQLCTSTPIAAVSSLRGSRRTSLRSHPASAETSPPKLRRGRTSENADKSPATRSEKNNSAPARTQRRTSRETAEFNYMDDAREALGLAQTRRKSRRWHSTFDASQPTTVKLRIGPKESTPDTRKSLIRSGKPTEVESLLLAPSQPAESPVVEENMEPVVSEVLTEERGPEIKPENVDSPESEVRRGSTRLKGKQTSYVEPGLDPEDGQVANSADGSVDSTKRGGNTSTTDSRENDDWCSACGRPGRFVCCEACTRSFHFLCINPPLLEDELPDSAWYCQVCVVKRPDLAAELEAGYAAEGLPIAKLDAEPAPQQGLFAELFQILRRQNPREFSLPQDLRTRFAGVTTGQYGEFCEELPAVSKTRAKAVNMLELDVKTEKDVALCFSCGLSGLQKKLMPCSRCISYWHADCMSVTNPSVPFVCPNHADLAARIPRTLKKPIVIDTKLLRGHINNGAIEVAVSEDEDEDDESDEDEEMDEDDEEPIRQIPFFDIKDSANGVSAPLPGTRRRWMAHYADKAVPRLPSRTIKLDFIDEVHSRTRGHFSDTPESQLLTTLDALAAQPERERKAVRDLAYLRLSESSAVPVAVARANLVTLVDAALDVENESRYKAIARLCEVKGRERLLEFLQS